ncbi:hypothetical protein [Streptomyces sp. NPDC048282]|uniref:hypothetical protein n=1 Tax=Streptomyces sp. NPDC048282 TaxID=3365528 RepID=UPI003714E27B
MNVHARNYRALSSLFRVAGNASVNRILRFLVAEKVLHTEFPQPYIRPVSDALSRTRWQQWEPLAIILLVEAGAFLFAVGWLTGVLMLWTSRQWRTRDKLVGTLFVPGGFAPVAVFTFWAKRCTTAVGVGGIAEERCGHISTIPWVDMLTLVVLWVAPLVSTAWLLRHHQAQPHVQVQSGRI